MIVRAATWRGRAGVTLVELLMTTAIMAVVATVVAMTMNVGVESWRTGTAIADESHHADAVMEQVVMALRSAYYPEGKGPDYDYGFQFQDDGETPDARDVLSWVKIGQSLIGEDVPWAGAAHRVELFVQDDESGDGPGLYVKAWQLVGQAEDFDPAEDVLPLLISDRVVSLDCRMKDPDKAEVGGEPYEWIDEWTASNRIPTHVLVSIAVKPQNEREEPLEYTRCVQIPMSAMSWNPIQTGARDGDRDRGNRRPGGTPGGVGDGGNGGSSDGGGIRRHGGVNIERGGANGPRRNDGDGGTRGGGRDRGRTRPGSTDGYRRDGGSGDGGSGGRDLRIRSIGGGR